MELSSIFVCKASISMNPISIVGAFIMTLSLLSYGIGSISLSRFRIVGSVVLIFLTMGIIFDITAIACMIIGAKGSPFSIHGVAGYIAFCVMLISTIWAWSVYFKKGVDAPVTPKFLWYSRLAYFLWFTGYLTGSLTILYR